MAVTLKQSSGCKTNIKDCINWKWPRILISMTVAMQRISKDAKLVIIIHMICKCRLNALLGIKTLYCRGIGLVWRIQRKCQWRRSNSQRQVVNCVRSKHRTLCITLILTRVPYKNLPRRMNVHLAWNKQRFARIQLEWRKEMRDTHH